MKREHGHSFEDYQRVFPDSCLRIAQEDIDPRYRTHNAIHCTGFTLFSKIPQQRPPCLIWQAILHRNLFLVWYWVHWCSVCLRLFQSRSPPIPLPQRISVEKIFWVAPKPLWLNFDELWFLRLSQGIRDDSWGRDSGSLQKEQARHLKIMQSFNSIIVLML